MNLNQQIERGIFKRFRKELWTPFIHAIQQYQLIQAGDCIAICISGGKDSFLTAKLFQALSRITTIPFSTKFITMDPGYTIEDRTKIIENAELFEIPLSLFESDLFETVTRLPGNPCYRCARMRRGFLYKHAQEMGCNKIALGHHYNDVVETILLGMLYGAQIQTMMPKLHSRNFAGMELIRPLYHVHEQDIVRWQNYHNLKFLKSGCRVLEDCSGSSKRHEMKLLLQQLKQIHPGVEKCIFRSVHDINLDTVIGYKLHGQEYSFLDHYSDAMVEEFS